MGTVEQTDDAGRHALMPKVLEILHNGPRGGHLGVTKTLHKVR